MEKRLSESEPQPSHSAWLRLAVKDISPYVYIHRYIYIDMSIYIYIYIYIYKEQRNLYINIRTKI